MQESHHQFEENQSAEVSLYSPPAHEVNLHAAVHAEGVAVGIEGLHTPSTDTVPELLDLARSDEYVQAFLQERQPVGPTEHLLVRELAHHAASMDLLNEAIGAVQRQGARELPEFARLAGENGSALHDAVLAGTMSQETLDRCEKQLRSHSRGFHRAWAS